MKAMVEIKRLTEENAGQFSEKRKRCEYEPGLLEMIPKRQQLGASIRLQEKVRQAILAIDNELCSVKNMEYRQILVKTGYALRDLSLQIQRQE